MLVKNWMSKNVVSVDENESMNRAAILMREKGIRMLPVLKKETLVGIVTDRDLKRASASEATTLDKHELKYVLNKVKIKSIMTKPPITVPPDLTVEETAEILLAHKISGVPVVDIGGRVVGTITQTDLFKVIISLTGIGKKGVQFAFQVDDRPGSIKEIADVVRAYGGRLASVLTSYDNVPEGYRKVYIRIYDLDRGRLRQLQDELILTANLLYFVDHRDNQRVIF